MSKEAMKLALEALLPKAIWNESAEGVFDVPLNEAAHAVVAIREALEEQATEDDVDATIIQYHEATIKRLEARIAKLEQSTQPQQEPVAWAFLSGQYAHLVWGKQRPDDEIHTIPLYPSPQPCPTCEALTRTVMLDQTSHDTQRKPLTDEQIESLWDHGMYVHCSGITALRAITRAIEAAHGIKGDA